MRTDELLALLNVLLEAERAGAKVLAAFLDEYEPGGAAWIQVRALQRDEATNCAVLMGLISRLNGVASKRTGDFLDRALAVEGRAARLKFLNRGQEWVARRIAEALPEIEIEPVRRALRDMHDAHRRNIELCEKLLETMD